MKLYGVRIQLLFGLFFQCDFSVSFRRNSTSGSAKGMTNIRNDILFVCFMAMKLQTEFGKSRFLQLVIDNIKCCQLFGNKKNFLSVAEALCNNVSDGLTFSCSRRPL